MSKTKALNLSSGSEATKPSRKSRQKTASPSGSSGSFVQRKGLQIVLIAWIDSTSLRGWSLHKEADEFAREKQDEIITVGFLLNEDDENVTVFQSRSKDQKNSLMKIPRVAIRDIRPIAAI